MSVSDNGLMIGVAAAAVVLLDVRCVVDEAREDRVLLLPPIESRTLDLVPNESRMLAD